MRSLGDGFLATFDGPARAVRCACSIAEAVRALDIQVRSGLHTGEIEVASDDVQGIAVIARLSAGRAGRYWYREPSRIWSPGQVFASTSEADIPLRVSRNRWTSTRLRIDAGSNGHPN